MSELIEVIAETFHTLHHLADSLSESGDETSRILLGDLELQLAKIESEGASLKQENLELHRHLGSTPSSETHIPKKSFPRLAGRGDVRQTMQVVSQFYQRYTRETQYRKAG